MCTTNQLIADFVFRFVMAKMWRCKKVVSFTLELRNTSSKKVTFSIQCLLTFFLLFLGYKIINAFSTSVFLSQRLLGYIYGQQNLQLPYSRVGLSMSPRFLPRASRQTYTAYLCLILMGCLHDPANVQQTSSKCNAGRLLDVCWIV